MSSDRKKQVLDLVLSWLSDTYKDIYDKYIENRVVVRDGKFIFYSSPLYPTFCNVANNLFAVCKGMVDFRDKMKIFYYDAHLMKDVRTLGEEFRYKWVIVNTAERIMKYWEPLINFLPYALLPKLNMVFEMVALKCDIERIRLEQ